MLESPFIVQENEENKVLEAQRILHGVFPTLCFVRFQWIVFLGVDGGSSLQLLKRTLEFRSADFRLSVADYAMRPVSL